MKILYLCHRTPYPPDKGDKLRAFHQIRALGEHHRIDLLTLADRPEDAQAPPALYAHCHRVEVFRIQRTRALWRCALRAASPRPLSLTFFECPALARRVAELARSECYDAVIAYSSAMAPYAEQVTSAPKILDMGDVDSAKWAQYSRFARVPVSQVYALEARRLRRYEAELCSRFDRVVMVTSQEVDLLRSFAPSAPVVSIPNGVDVDFFRPLDLPKAERATLVFTGQMDYFANVDGVAWFAREILPRLHRRLPETRLLIVGRSPAPAVRRLSRLPGVTVTGTVEDIRPYLARAWAFVAPLRIAQGIQNKVLEAMASDLPVVATDQVMAGLRDGEFRDGVDLFAAGSAADFEDAVTRLLESADLRRAMGASARARLLASFSWKRNHEGFERLLSELVRKRVARPPAPGL